MEECIPLTSSGGPEQAALLSLCFEQCAEGILLIQTGRKVWMANPQFRALFGLDQAELEAEILRIGHVGNWDRSFPFSIKHTLALPVGEGVTLRLLRSGDEAVMAELFRTQIFDSFGNEVVMLTARQIALSPEDSKNQSVVEDKSFSPSFEGITLLDQTHQVVFSNGYGSNSDLDQQTLALSEPFPEYGGNGLNHTLKTNIDLALGGTTKVIELSAGKSTFRITTTPLLVNELQKGPLVLRLVRDISFEKLASDQAELGQAYLRQIIDVDPNLIYIRNREGRVIMANKSVADFFGCSVSAFLDQSAELFKTFKWKYEELEYLDDQIFSTLKTITSEEALFNKETRRMHLFQVTRTTFVTSSNEISILYVGVDITDRVNAENELITQREYLRHILDTDPSFIFVKDHRGRFILVNKAFADFYKTSPDALLGKSDDELPWRPSDRETFRNSDRMVIEANETITLEEHSLNPITGKDVYFVTTKKPLLDADGNLNILGVVTDITAQKVQEVSLKKSEQMLQEIFNRVADALLILDFRNNTISDCNEQALTMLKAESKDWLVGREVSEIRPAEDAGQQFWNIFLQEEANVSETELAAFDGTRFWGGLASTRFSLEGKELVLLRISDISSQKASEEQIIQALHEKEILIQEIHHRVKNNMAVISSLLQLQTGYIKDTSLIDVFKDSQSRIKSMALIHEKLYQSKTLAKLEMESYIKELARTLLYTYNSRRIDIQIHTFADNVFLDINSAVPCGLIINEIISNACKHAFAGRSHGRIDISFTRQGDIFHLKMHDDGIGMPPETNLANFKSLGMNLIHALASQLGAHLEITIANGVGFQLSFTEKTKPNREQVRNGRI